MATAVLPSPFSAAPTVLPVADVAEVQVVAPAFYRKQISPFTAGPAQTRAVSASATSIDAAAVDEETAVVLVGAPPTPQNLTVFYNDAGQVMDSGQPLARVATFDRPNYFSADCFFDAPTSRLTFRDGTQAADAQIFRVENAQQILAFTALNDRLDVSTLLMTMNRVGDVWFRGKVTAPAGFFGPGSGGGSGGPHAPTHQPGGTDPILALDAGILTTGTLANTRLSVDVLRVAGGYITDTTKYLRADGQFGTPAGGGGGTGITDAVGVAVYASGVQSVPHAAWTTLSFDALDFDIGGMRNGQTRFLVPTGQNGSFLLVCSTTFSAAATGQRLLKAFINGTTEVAGGLMAGAAWETTVSYAAIIHLNVGDYVEFRVYQDSGTSMSVGATTAPGYSRAQVMRQTAGAGAAGNVNGPASTTLRAVAVYADTTGKVLTDGAGVAPSLKLNGGYPQLTLELAGVTLIQWNALSGAVDAKKWRMWVNPPGTTFNIDCLNDAETTVLRTPLQIDRATGTVTFSGQVQLPAINPTLKFGGATSAFPALRNSGATLEVITADTPASLYTGIKAMNFVSVGTGNNFGDLTITGGFSVGAATLLSGELDCVGGSGTAFSTAPIEVRTTLTPRIAFHWPGVVASQLGMDSAGTIRTYDNPGTGYAAFACSKIVANAVGNNLADLTCGPTNFTVGLNVTGGQASTFAGPLYSTQYVYSGGVMYPGRIDNGAAQLSWYLASHASYGLYSNTGLYLAAGVYTGGDSSVGGLLTAGRRFTFRNIISTTYRAVPGDFVLCQGNVTVVLPAPTDGAVVDVKVYAGSPGTVTVLCDNYAYYIDWPATAFVLTAANQCATFVGGVNQWFVR